MKKAYGYICVRAALCPIGSQRREIIKLAEKGGITLASENILIDTSTIRPNWAVLNNLIVDGRVQTVFLADLKSMARRASQGRELIDTIRSHQIVVLTADGFDSRQEGWETTWLTGIQESISDIYRQSVKTGVELERRRSPVERALLTEMSPQERRNYAKRQTYALKVKEWRRVV